MYGYAGGILGGPLWSCLLTTLEPLGEMMYGYAGSILGSPLVLSCDYST